MKTLKISMIFTIPITIDVDVDMEGGEDVLNDLGIERVALGIGVLGDEVVDLHGEAAHAVGRDSSELLGLGMIGRNLSITKDFLLAR